MAKYIDAEELKEKISNLEYHRYYSGDFHDGVLFTIEEVQSIIDSLQHEQPMPDSTKLIELWHEDKEMLKEKDFRNDPWRLAYNAFLCGFGRGIAVNKQEQPEVDLEAFRREAAKDILVALCTTMPISMKEDVRQAINIADELIKQLKEEQL